MILRTPFPYENYAITPCGKVKNRKTGRFLNPTKNHDGYRVVGLIQDKKLKHFRVHRLVAKLYLPNPLNLPQVNHKDFDKSNNHVDNLEWCTGKENSNHAALHGRVGGRHPRPVHKVSRNAIIATYPSVHDAANKNGLDFSNIYAVCRGNRETCGGFYWEFA